MGLIDNHGRPINYLRLAVTDRCNLRCFYCMPEHGIDWLARKELMSYEEMLRLCTHLTHMGIEKIRITGGEPFARKGIMEFLTQLSQLKQLKELTITTNGVLTEPYIPELKNIGVKSVNISLDTLDRERFYDITKRDELPKVLSTIDALLKHDIDVKINAVVMEGRNTEDIIPLANLTKEYPISVRYIEEMPFNGSDRSHTLTWNHVHILQTLQDAHPSIAKIADPAYSTSYNYTIDGHKGNIGIIAAYTRSFCGSCNRIRITPLGELKTCLYGDSVLNVKDIMRSHNNNEALEAAILNAIGNRAKDGKQAEQLRNKKAIHESMATIGG